MNDIKIMKKYITDICAKKEKSLMSIPPQNNDFDELGFRLLDELEKWRNEERLCLQKANCYTIYDNLLKVSADKFIDVYKLMKNKLETLEDKTRHYTEGQANE